MLDMFDLRIHRSQTRRRPRSFGTPTVDKTHNDWCKYNNPGAGHLVDGTVNGASSCPQRDERRQFQQRRDGEARKPTDVDVSDWTKRPRQGDRLRPQRHRLFHLHGEDTSSGIVDPQQHDAGGLRLCLSVQCVRGTLESIVLVVRKGVGRSSEQSVLPGHARAGRCPSTAQGRGARLRHEGQCEGHHERATARGVSEPVRGLRVAVYYECPPPKVGARNELEREKSSLGIHRVIELVASGTRMTSGLAFARPVLHGSSAPAQSAHSNHLGSRESIRSRHSLRILRQR